MFLDADIDRQRPTLATPDAALVDVKSKRFYGALATGVVTELAQRRIHVVGTFALGTDFAYDGNVILSDRNFLKYFPQRRSADGDLGPVDLGLLRVTAGAGHHRAP